MAMKTCTCCCGRPLSTPPLSARGELLAGLMFLAILVGEVAFVVICVVCQITGWGH